MKKIAVSTSTFGEYDTSPITLCRKKGYEVTLNPYRRKLRPDEIPEFAKNAVGLIAGTEIISGEAITKLPSLRVISRCGTGMDNVDLQAAKTKGIEVFNTPDAPTLAVAEFTITLMISLLRKVALMDRAMRQNKWKKLMGSLLCGKKVGIIGFGRIGRKVSQLLKPFNCQVSYYDIKEDGDLDKLLQTSDIISLHVSGTPKKPLIGRSELKRMKKGSYLINASRGGVLDEVALYDALKKGHIAGAALDVFENEPYRGPLRKLDNVILTPHVGSYAREARVEMERQAVLNLLEGLDAIRENKD